jgi:cytochrome c peroxidase
MYKNRFILLIFLAIAFLSIAATWAAITTEEEPSARRKLILIYTKSLTGINADIEKATQELEELKNGLEAENLLRANHITAFAAASNYLQATSKEKFNYFEFYQKYFLPLYQTLPLEQQPTTSDADKNGIFDAAFLNPLVFAELEKDKTWNERLELGRLLFHEPLFSGNNKRSCASCHQAEKGFTDGVAKSPDFDSTGTVDRNAPTLINAVFARPYLHDRSHFFLENQFHQVLEHPKEFRTKYWDIMRKISHSPEYVTRFQKAFPASKKMNVEGIEVALKTYVASLVALNSDFDQMIRGEKAPNLTVAEGYNIFMGKANCGSCHYPPLFSGLRPPYYDETEGHATGVPATSKKLKKADTKDLGAALVPNPENPALLYQFKTPTLRNIFLTSPYMHNGVFANLEDAVDFMCSGGNKYKNRTSPLTPVTLTPSEKSQLMAFLQSLNDTNFGFEPKPAQLPALENFNEKVSRNVGAY